VSDDAIVLPPLSPHDHPDPQSFTWSRTEIDAIQTYARAVAAQARRRALEEAAKVCGRWYVEPCDHVTGAVSFTVAEISLAIRALIEKEAE
jgi:hypothetical protein